MMLSNSCALILARGGSKGIPNKNLTQVGGLTLISRSIQACLSAQLEVFLSTDSEQIAEEARKNGAHVIQRPSHLANDTATSESAISHAVETHLGNYEYISFVQPTSPFIQPEDVSNSFSPIIKGHADSVFSAVEDFSFPWVQSNEATEWVPQNHSKNQRPRRQELRPRVKETGAFYTFRTATFNLEQTRFCGKTVPAYVDPHFSIEIDEPQDLMMANFLEPLWLDKIRRKFAEGELEIKAVAYDFDGVMTDNKVMVNQDGEESIVFSRFDGFGVGSLRKLGVAQAIFSTEENPVVLRRAEKLRILAFHGLADKRIAVEQWANELGISLSQVAFLGNDLNDEDVMRSVGFPVSVHDAHPTIRAMSKIVLQSRGGDGAVRELAEMIFRRKGRNLND